jgi:hypothetical protein
MRSDPALPLQSPPSEMKSFIRKLDVLFWRRGSPNRLINAARVLGRARRRRCAQPPCPSIVAGRWRSCVHRHRLDTQVTARISREKNSISRARVGPGRRHKRLGAHGHFRMRSPGLFSFSGPRARLIRIFIRASRVTTDGAETFSHFFLAPAAPRPARPYFSIAA